MLTFCAEVYGLTLDRQLTPLWADNGKLLRFARSLLRNQEAAQIISKDTRFLNRQQIIRCLESALLHGWTADLPGSRDSKR